MLRTGGTLSGKPGRFQTVGRRGIGMAPVPYTPWYAGGGSNGRRIKNKYRRHYYAKSTATTTLKGIAYRIALLAVVVVIGSGAGRCGIVAKLHATAGAHLCHHPTNGLYRQQQHYNSHKDTEPTHDYKYTNLLVCIALFG